MDYIFDLYPKLPLRVLQSPTTLPRIEEERTTMTQQYLQTSEFNRGVASYKYLCKNRSPNKKRSVYHRQKQIQIYGLQVLLLICLTSVGATGQTTASRSRQQAGSAKHLLRPLCGRRLFDYVVNLCEKHGGLGRRLPGRRRNHQMSSLPPDVVHECCHKNCTKQFLERACRRKRIPNSRRGIRTTSPTTAQPTTRGRRNLLTRVTSERT